MPLTVEPTQGERKRILVEYYLLRLWHPLSTDMTEPLLGWHPSGSSFANYQRRPAVHSFLQACLVRGAKGVHRSDTVTVPDSWAWTLTGAKHASLRAHALGPHAKQPPMPGSSKQRSSAPQGP